MLRNLFYIVLLLLLFSCSSTYNPSLPISDSAITTEIYPIQDVTDTIKNIFLHKDYYNIEASVFMDVKSLYLQSNYRPLWQSDSLIEQGIALLSKTDNHGLNPKYYNKALIDSLNTSRVNDSLTKIQTLGILDIAITNGVLLLCSHLLKGKLNPKHYHEAWNYPKREVSKIDSVLLNLINSNKVMEIEKTFQPNTIAYTELQKELIRFETLKNNGIKYSKVEYPGFVLGEGDSNSYVLQLKQELKVRGYISEDSLNLVFDSTLENAIKAFQKKHGLITDGKPGTKTYAFLNWSLGTYINRLKVNLERIRWQDDSKPEQYITVNIPAYQLKLYSNKELRFSSRVIVGKYNNQTPVFESKINYLVFNPCWTIPNSIASDKILLRIQKDTTYLDKRNMFISLNGVTQDHSTIDFSQYTEDTFPYKIFQRTGAGNALGKVKFMFDNKYSIYLHDTPGKSLFARDNRAFSHGCVRVQNAMDLSEILLHKIDNITKPLSYYLEKGYPEKVYLNTEIPLQINYFTCDYNKEFNQVQFFKDVYAIDYKIYQDLQK